MDNNEKEETPVLSPPPPSPTFGLCDECGCYIGGGEGEDEAVDDGESLQFHVCGESLCPGT